MRRTAIIGTKDDHQSSQRTTVESLAVPTKSLHPWSLWRCIASSVKDTVHPPSRLQYGTAQRNASHTFLARSHQQVMSTAAALRHVILVPPGLVEFGRLSLGFPFLFSDFVGSSGLDLVTLSSVFVSGGGLSHCYPRLHSFTFQSEFET